MYVRIHILQGRGGGGAGSEGYVKKEKKGVRLYVTRRVGSQQVVKSFQTPLPCMFLLGEKLLGVKSRECSFPVFFPSPLGNSGNASFYSREVELRAGFFLPTSSGSDRKSRWPSSFHLCRLISHLS